MKRPLAYRHLVRLHELVTSASICRAVAERGLLAHALVDRGVADDRALAEEILALAREREWSFPEPQAYAWTLFDDDGTDVRPRIVRVLARDVFELDGIYRATDDDDVGSLAAEVRDRRRTLREEFATETPELTLPGAK